MRINEVYNPHDRLVAKLKDLKYNFASDVNEIELFCKDTHIVGNAQSTAQCRSIIDNKIVEIDRLLNNQFDDDLLVLFQQDAARIKDRLLALKSSL